MTLREKIARVIFTELGNYDLLKDECLTVADAVIEALGLTEEKLTHTVNMWVKSNTDKQFNLAAQNDLAKALLEEMGK